MEDQIQTRLIVKNLPQHCDDKRLRDHFGVKGNVTDARVARSKEGKSRLFGFVGFASEEDAKRALKYFNSTFLDTSRIQVDVARPKGDPTIPRPWSKHAPGSSSFKGGARAAAVAAPGSDVPASGDGKRGVKRPRVTSAAASARGGASSEAASAPDGPNSLPPCKVGRSGASEDTEKEEFMAAMKRRSQAKFWANDAAEIEAAAEPKLIKSGGNGSGHDSASEDSLEAFKEDDDPVSSDYSGSDAEFSGKIHAEPTIAAASASGSGASDMDWLRSRRVVSLSAEAAAGGAALIAVDAGTSDEGDSSDSDEDVDTGGSGGGEASAFVAAPAAAAAADSDDRKVANNNVEDEGEEEDASGRLFVRNLPFDCSEEDLQALFGAFGVVSEAHVPLDDLGRGKGFAFVQFLLPENAENARVALDRRPFKGRLLHILPARVQPGGGGGGRSGSSDGTNAGAAGAAGGTYKARKEAERRAAVGDTAGWNSAFVRSDTVVDALAHRLGVAKGEVLDREEGDMAVRLALGETQLIRENREYFEREGVDLSALESAAVRANKSRTGGTGKAERSDTVILVKNLPFSTEVGELAALFGAHGSLSRVLLPPSHTVALVEFSAAADAKRAFKRVAYKRFQHVPLYLEWAPVKVFTRPATAAAATAAVAAAGAAANAAKNTTAAAAAAADRSVNRDDNAEDGSAHTTATAAEAMAGRAAAGAREAAVAAVTGVDEDVAAAGGDSSEANTIYVKNLAFSTTEESLKKAFGFVSGLRAVAIPRKRPLAAGNSVSAGLSMGFGFVEFASAAGVEEALKKLQGCMLDGHALQLKRSTKRLTAKPPAATAAAAGSGAAAAAGRRTKIIVRNVAFQATAKEIRELFGAYGRVKRVRLPKKFDGGHRGFAFVEYALPREAADAFQALASTHLYGRHLVLEWAAEDADGDGNVEALQAKAAKEARAARAHSGGNSGIISFAAGLGGDGGLGEKKTVFESDGEEED